MSPPSRERRFKSKLMAHKSSTADRDSSRCAAITEEPDSIVFDEQHQIFSFKPDATDSRTQNLLRLALPAACVRC